jgi:hypothetical protein
MATGNKSYHEDDSRSGKGRPQPPTTATPIDTNEVSSRLLASPLRPKSTPYHIVERNLCCASQQVWVFDFRVGVKLRKAHGEHFWAAVPQKAALLLRRSERRVRAIPVRLGLSISSPDHRRSLPSRQPICMFARCQEADAD